MSATASIASGHLKSCFYQLSAQKGSNDGVEIATDKADDPDTRSDQRPFENVRKRSAEQDLHTQPCHFCGPSERIAANKRRCLAMRHLTADDVRYPDGARDVENGRYPAVPVCSCDPHVRLSHASIVP